MTRRAPTVLFTACGSATGFNEIPLPGRIMLLVAACIFVGALQMVAANQKNHAERRIVSHPSGEVKRPFALIGLKASSDLCRSALCRVDVHTSQARQLVESPHCVLRTPRIYKVLPWPVPIQNAGAGR
jgi:hypothetical protein